MWTWEGHKHSDHSSGSAMANYLRPLPSEGKWNFPAEDYILAGRKEREREIVMKGEMVEKLCNANSICCNMWNGMGERKYRTTSVRGWAVWCWSVHCTVLLSPVTPVKSVTWKGTLIFRDQEGICWCTRHAEESKSSFSALNDTGELMQLLHIRHQGEWEVEESYLSDLQSLSLALPRLQRGTE